jgi:hypothetical protein
MSGLDGVLLRRQRLRRMGRISAVYEATGIARSTVGHGLQELRGQAPDSPFGGIRRAQRQSSKMRCGDDPAIRKSGHMVDQYRWQTINERDLTKLVLAQSFQYRSLTLANTAAARHSIPVSCMKYQLSRRSE